MMRRDVHAALEIKTVGGEALHARIEGEVFAAVFPGVFDQPIEKSRAESAGAIGIVGNQIVDGEGAAGNRRLKIRSPATERNARSNSRYAS